jgi:hypothetical protein
VPGQNATDITWWAVVSAFGGAIIGSGLGGLINFFLQRKSLAATKALRDADRREVRKALGYALFFKMIRLSSDLAQLGQPVWEAVEKAKREGSSVLWPLVPPVAALPDPIKFSPEEMALVLSLDNELFNNMAALDDLHKSTVEIFRLYSDMRKELTNTLRPSLIVGQMGSILLTKEERERMQPRSVELDMLINGMEGRTQQDGQIAWHCLVRLHRVLEKEFDLKHRLDLKEGYMMVDPPNVEFKENAVTTPSTVEPKKGYTAATSSTARNPAKTQKYYHHYKG